MPVSIASSAKFVGLQLEEHRPLGADVDAIEPAQTRSFRHQPVDAARIGAGEPEIGLDAGFDRRASCLGLEKVGVEPFQSIVPVVISGNCIDRLGKPLEGKVEIGLVVVHGACRIDHVGGHDEKFYLIVPPEIQSARDQRILRSVALSGVADDDEAEIPGAVDAVGTDAEQIVVIPP